MVAGGNEWIGCGCEGRDTGSQVAGRRGRRRPLVEEMQKVKATAQRVTKVVNGRASKKMSGSNVDYGVTMRERGKESKGEGAKEGRCVEGTSGSKLAQEQWKKLL